MLLLPALKCLPLTVTGVLPSWPISVETMHEFCRHYDGPFPSATPLVKIREWSPFLAAPQQKSCMDRSSNFEFKMQWSYVLHNASNDDE